MADPQRNLAKRIRASDWATSVEGGRHRGGYGRIRGRNRATDTNELTYLVRLDDGTEVELPAEDIHLLP